MIGTTERIINILRPLISEPKARSISIATITRRLPVVIWGVIFGMTSLPVLGQTAFCQDVQESVELSKTGFSSIQLTTKKTVKSFDTSILLFDAKDCEIFASTTNRTLKCTWAFSFDDAMAETHYEELLAAVSVCLANDVSISKDQPVNHPDTFKSHIFQLTDTQLRVTLKNKYALKKKFVSMLIDGKA